MEVAIVVDNPTGQTLYTENNTFAPTSLQIPTQQRT
jgi:hypothetical protein